MNAFLGMMMDPELFSKLHFNEKLKTFVIDKVIKSIGNNSIVTKNELLQDEVDTFSVALAAQDNLPFVLNLVNNSLAQQMGFQFEDMVIKCLFEGKLCDPKKFFILIP